MHIEIASVCVVSIRILEVTLYYVFKVIVLGAV